MQFIINLCWILINILMYTLVFLGIIGNILSIIFFLSPILIMVNLIKTGETKTVPSLLFMFTLLNCELWFIYGVQEDSWEIYICNFIGLLLNTIYLNLFCVYLKNMKTYPYFSLEKDGFPKNKLALHLMKLHCIINL